MYVHTFECIFIASCVCICMQMYMYGCMYPRMYVYFGVCMYALSYSSAMKRARHVTSLLCYKLSSTRANLRLCCLQRNGRLLLVRSYYQQTSSLLLCHDHDYDLYCYYCSMRLQCLRRISTLLLYVRYVLYCFMLVMHSIALC